MIGDSNFDVLAGKNLGVPTAVVGWSIKGEEKIRTYEADYILSNMRDLIAIVGAEQSWAEKRSDTQLHQQIRSGTFIKLVPFWKVVKNFIVIQLARYTPFIGVKNWLYRVFLRIKVGDETAVALMVMMDVMFPERISIGRKLDHRRQHNDFSSWVFN